MQHISSSNGVIDPQDARRLYPDPLVASTMEDDPSMNDPLDAFFTVFPELETDRLLLRQIRPDDAAAILAIFKDDAVTEFYDLETFKEMDEARELIAYFTESYLSERQIRWGITRKQDDQLLGTCGFVSLHPHRGEIGYDLARAYWRQGYMSEAVAAMLELGFDEMGLNRIEALVMVNNVASASLLRSLGFSNEGILRQYDYFKGAFHDLSSFSLLASEYAAWYR